VLKVVIPLLVAIQLTRHNLFQQKSLTSFLPLSSVPTVDTISHTVGSIDVTTNQSQLFFSIPEESNGTWKNDSLQNSSLPPSSPSITTSWLYLHRYFLSARFGRNNSAAPVVLHNRQYVQQLNIFPGRHMFHYDTFPNFILQDSRFVPHLQFLENDPHPTQVGAGFWFWKAQLIVHHLQSSVPYNDFLLYADADLFNQFRWLDEMQTFMIVNNANLALYQTPYLHRHYTKRDVFDRFCRNSTDGHGITNPATDDSHQNACGMMLIRKTTGIMRLMQQWADAVSDFQLVNDETYSTEPNVADFHENRRDQSVFNAMLLCVYPNITRVKFIPANHSACHRSLDGGNGDSCEWHIETIRIPE
jgi:hypothetical protein